jgi:hypothetical protein
MAPLMAMIMNRTDVKAMRRIIINQEVLKYPEG